MNFELDNRGRHIGKAKKRSGPHELAVLGMKPV